MAPNRRTRFIVAFLVGAGTAALTYSYLHIAQPGVLGYDFTWPWRAARAMLAGQNPYTTVRSSGGVFPFDGNFLYTLPGAFVAVPFAWMAPDAAAAAFSGVSAGLLAFGLSAEGYDRFPIFLSTPFLITALTGQWSSLLMAAALLPAISWLAVCKPTLGAAAFLYRPNWIAVIVGGALLALSFLIQPTWVRDWLDNIRLQPGNRYYSPVRVLPFGPLLLLAALRWRTPEGRWLFMLSIAPQVLVLYSAFPAMLVARTRREAMALAALSLVAWLGITFALRGPDMHREMEPVIHGYWIVPLIFLPALAIVLRRANH